MCIHIAAGDGYVQMADGTPLYIFGFSDVTGVMQDMVMHTAMLGANFPGPAIFTDEGSNVYLTLTNVGMLHRPDLFDPHTIHWHGFPNAAIVFDGEPMGSIAINMGASLTYYYQAPDPGTYMYHCHVEATEHMQMGMLGNLYVRPLQNQGNAGLGIPPGKYTYNDGVLPSDPKSTAYDREFLVQIHAFDSIFHEQHIGVQPLPFADMRDDYAMLNGRGYPDTVNTAPLGALGDPYNNGQPSQRLNTLIRANSGEKVLLRVSSLSTVEFYTLTVLGIPMKVIGKDAKIMAGPTGNANYYDTSSVTLGGGQATDILFQAPSVTVPTTYFLYTTNLNNLSNGTEDFGGMMTEIVIYPSGTLPAQAGPNT
jgi:FtsP/CotA-like multicopper oxidase with cupredoxin domain